MKSKIIFTLVFLFSIATHSQIGSNNQTSNDTPPDNPTNIVEICSGIGEEDVPNYTYFKDINNTFTKFMGIWKYTNGNSIVKFEIVKVVQAYDPEFKIFEDYLVGNYSYSTDGGTTYVVNTISTLFSPSPESNPMYSSCAEENKISFIFSDETLLIRNAWIYFEFLPNSLTQMTVEVKNEGTIGSFEGTPEYNTDLVLPTSMTVTKQ